jgi:uncharacterized protein YidB (DUF937 family)
MTFRRSHRVFGFVHPLPDIGASLITPLFGTEKSTYLQSANDDIIAEFIPYRVPDTVPIIPSRHQGYYRKLGDPALHAFFLSNSDLVIGSRSEVSAFISKNWSRMPDDPFLRIDLSRFLGDQGRFFEAVERAEEILGKINETIARKWRNETIASQSLRPGLKKLPQEERRAGLEAMIRTSSSGGNIGKPLMLALGALLASGALFGGRQIASAGSQPTTDTSDAGGVLGGLGGLGGLLNKLQQGGLGNQVNSWVGPGPNQPVSPVQLAQALGPNVIKTLSQMTGLSEDELTKQLSQNIPLIVNTLTPNGRLPTVAELSKMME